MLCPYGENRDLKRSLSRQNCLKYQFDKNCNLNFKISELCCDFIKKKPKPIIWLYLVMAIIGSYLISFNGKLEFEIGDILTFICAFMFAFQIVLIDIVNPHIDSVKLSAIEFLVAGFLSIIFMLFQISIGSISLVNILINNNRIKNTLTLLNVALSIIFVLLWTIYPSIFGDIIDEIKYIPCGFDC